MLGATVRNIGIEFSPLSWHNPREMVQIWSREYKLGAAVYHFEYGSLMLICTFQYISMGSTLSSSSKSTCQAWPSDDQSNTAADVRGMVELVLAS